jgi:hypothetical protein
MLQFARKGHGGEEKGNGIHLHPAGSEVPSPWWNHGVILVLILGFTILIWQAAKTSTNGPPIPERVVGPQARRFSRQRIFSLARKSS